MGFFFARIRLWAAHRRLLWWLIAASLALITGRAVDAALAQNTCLAEQIVTVAPPDEQRPQIGERAIALTQDTDRLSLTAGDRVDLYAVDDYAPTGRLLVENARVLDQTEQGITVAVPMTQVADVAAARHWGEIALALTPG